MPLNVSNTSAPVETSIFGNNKPSLFDNKATENGGSGDKTNQKLFGSGSNVGSLFGDAGSNLMGGTLFQQSETKPADTKGKPSMFASLLQEIDPKESGNDAILLELRLNIPTFLSGNSLFANYLNTGTQTFDDLLKRSTSSNMFGDQKKDDDDNGKTNYP